MYVQHHAVRNHGVHRGFYGSAQRLATNHSCLARRVCVGIHAANGFRQADGHQNLFPARVGQPFARRFYPQDIVQLDRRVSCSRLHQHWVTPNSAGNCQQTINLGRCACQKNTTLTRDYHFT